jgi:succinate dehydrogenase/fumarate reductase flavoprotein subunit
MSLKKKVDTVLSGKRGTTDEELLLDLQKLIFRYDVSILKSEERLGAALGKLEKIKGQARMTPAENPHCFVRLQETQAMIDAAEIIFRASLVRQETRLSHMREDFPKRDDKSWLEWVLVRERDGSPFLWTEPIRTSLVPAPEASAASHPGSS